jgi:hypothetical protein
VDRMTNNQASDISVKAADVCERCGRVRVLHDLPGGPSIHCPGFREDQWFLEAGKRVIPSFSGEVSSEPRIKIYARGDRSSLEVQGGLWKEYTWRAICSLPPAMGHSQGVMGGDSPDGPWVEGWGHSPAAALEAATLAVGRATLSTSSLAFVSKEKR